MAMRLIGIAGRGKRWKENRAMHLLRMIEIFLKETGMAPTRFGRNSVRDPRLVFDMRNGREPGERTQRRVAHFIAHYRNGASQ